MPKPAIHDIAKLGSAMLRFAAQIHAYRSPDEVLDSLHKVTLAACNISVLVAGLLPLRWGDWSGFENGKTVFLHKSAPDGWWEEWLELSRMHSNPGLALARLSLAPFIRSEMMTMLQPLGIDRWAVDLELNTAFATAWCARWAGAGCSRTGRARFYLSASPTRLGLVFSWEPTFAAIRLQQLAGPHVGRISQPASLTARELAVLRLLSDGRQIAEAACLLGIGEETVRTHLKKAQGKLGAKIAPMSSHRRCGST
jgi:LuxR family quorum sensing-dependent transcriptional regulator